jgi:choline monooxygenase
VAKSGLVDIIFIIEQYFASRYLMETQLSLQAIVQSYNPRLALAEAFAPPAAWYIDPRILELEKHTVFSRSWQMVARSDQLRQSGRYVATEIAGEPVLIVRGNDAVLRAFFNVCRHKGSPVVCDADGRVQTLRCPYHAWTYSLEGELKGAPDFTGVTNFDRSRFSLVPLQTAEWQRWVFVRLCPEGPSLDDFLERDLVGKVDKLNTQNLQWFERRHYMLECNWKVFVDNYLDGGYHVPHLHRGLNNVLDYSQYTIETGERFCLQTSPIVPDRTNGQTGAVRKGKQALYLWIYPNLMINYYDGVMDTNLLRPLSVDRTEVIFDFYFADITEKARDRNLASIAVSERIQEEDVGICNSVQRGLRSRAYLPGRLSVRREAGEQLFHKLLYTDYKAGLKQARKKSGV